MPSDLTENNANGQSDAATAEEESPMLEIIKEQRELINELIGKQKIIVKDIISLRRKVTGKDKALVLPSGSNGSGGSDNSDNSDNNPSNNNIVNPDAQKNTQELHTLREQVSEMGLKLLNEKAINLVQAGLKDLNKKNSELACYAVIHKLGHVTEEADLEKIPALIKETLELFPDLQKSNTTPNIPTVNRADTSGTIKEDPIKSVEEAGSRFKEKLKKLG